MSRAAVSRKVKGILKLKNCLFDFAFKGKFW